MSSGGSVEMALGLLERWLDMMRGPGGYGGPVVHWWRDSILFCGPGLDWRYEGIIDGYLGLFDRSGRSDWLEKARRAGDDLVAGQLDDGTFRHSSFERNPRPGGTPHEAAADVGLLLLAKTLRARSDPGWARYLETAETNVRQILLGRLWRSEARRFGDGGGWFVPNKAATIIEALCLLADVTGREEYVARYVQPTADAILSHQVVDAGGPLDGGIAQASLGSRRVEKYFPYYTARSIPGLLAAYRASGDERYLDAALRAGSFVLRWRDEDGGAPQVAYPGRRVNRYPRWIAGAGDTVRALHQLNEYGLAADYRPTLGWILGGQLASGAIRVAQGFASQVSQRRPRDVPEVRDLMPVVGWNDKAFRALSRLAATAVVLPPASPVELACSWGGRAGTFREDSERVMITSGRSQLYSWQRGRLWASLA